MPQQNEFRECRRNAGKRPGGSVRFTKNVTYDEIILFIGVERIEENVRKRQSKSHINSINVVVMGHRLLRYITALYCRKKQPTADFLPVIAAGLR